MAISKRRTLDLVFSGLLLAIGMVLPFLTSQIPEIGSRLLPLHLPVLLCGILCGWQYGLAVGFVLPLLRSLIFGMPPMMPTAVAMAFELAAYGAVSGYVSAKLPRTLGSIYASLVAAMLAGRVVWGLVSWLLYSLMGSRFTWQIFFVGAFGNAVIGIAVQLMLVPALVVAVWKAMERSAQQ